MRIAILTSVFIPEYGVARVIASQVPYLVKAGMAVDLYACELRGDMVPKGVKAVRIPTHLKGLRWCLKKGRYDVIIAHTDPFCQFLAEDNCGAVTIGYEHGYPPVELCLPEERENRLKMIGDRLGYIYPRLSGVIAISNYARDYVQWPKADVIYNGADHYREYETSASHSVVDENGPISILAVTRFRKEEWQYKGLENLCRLAKELGKGYRIKVVGGGDEETCARLKDAGVEAHSSVSSPAEMAKLYNECDALASFSIYETFNLPLAEAGFAHKPAIALNVRVHPEVTPFVFNSYEEIRDYLRTATRSTLKADGEKMFQFVDSRFRWEQNGTALVGYIKSKCPAPASRRPAFGKNLVWSFWGLREFVRQNFYKKWKRRA